MADPEPNPTEEQIRMGDLVRSHFPGGKVEFSPFALYPDTLDRIWVLTRDCSHTEVPVNEILTLMIDNYPASREVQEDPCIGFAIESAYAVCKSLNLINGEFVDLHEVLSALLVQFPRSAVEIQRAHNLLTRLPSLSVLVRPIRRS